MKTTKGFVSPLLLAAIAILLISGGVYLYTQNKKENLESSQAVANLPVTADILPDTYSNLTDYEKSLINRMNTWFSDNGSDSGVARLKFYDDKTVVFVTVVPKPGADLGIYDIKTLKELSTLYFLASGNYIESSDYIIAATFGPLTPHATTSDEYFVFYKKGATDFQTIPNSALSYLASSGSVTYQKDDGRGSMGIPSYDFSFDQPTKTLTASVFTRDKGSALNTKIRTVKFVLP